MTRYMEIALLIAGIWLMYLTAARGDDTTALNLARCMRAETDSYSGENNQEWAAMAHVLRKRAKQSKRTLNKTILAYCAVFDRRGAAYYQPRSKAIRASTFEAPLHGRPAEWQKLREFSQAFMGGRIADPCPEAMHFGADYDVGPDSSLVEVCHHLGERGNKFFRVRQ